MEMEIREDFVQKIAPICHPTHHLHRTIYKTQQALPYVMLRIILSLENLIEKRNDRNLVDIEQLEIEFIHLEKDAQKYFNIIGEKTEKSSDEIAQQMHLKNTCKIERFFRNSLYPTPETFDQNFIV